MYVGFSSFLGKKKVVCGYRYYEQFVLFIYLSSPGRRYHSHVFILHLKEEETISSVYLLCIQNFLKRLFQIVCI